MDQFFLLLLCFEQLGEKNPDYAESIAKQEESLQTALCVCVCARVTRWLSVLFCRWRFMSRASRKFRSGNLITLNYCSGLWLMLLAESMLVSRTCSVIHLNQVTVVLLSLK